MSTFGYGRKINPNWTFLGKNIFTLQTSTNMGTGDRIQQRLRFGFAYRQTDQNRWAGLGRYELKYEQNGLAGGTFNRLVHIFSTHLNYHPDSRWTHSARFAAKKVAESSAQFDSKSLTMLLSARSMYDITDKLDGAINASLMSNAGFESKDYGLGAEIGYILTRNLRLALGYNLFGFKDRDLAASNYTRQGVYLGFSYKFDERLFHGLIPEEDQNEEIYKTCPACKAQKVLHLPKTEVTLAGLKPVQPKAMDITRVKQRAFTLPKNIHFALDKSVLSHESQKILALVADFLSEQSTFKLEITGHTDSRGASTYNLNLSERRAYAVQQYLVGKGIDKDMIALSGLSEQDLYINPEADAIDRALNRRVELNLNLPDATVRFIPQISDLQIEANQAWDYLFNTRLYAVPDRIHIEGDSLSEITKYLLHRILLAIEYYPGETVIFKVAGAKRIHKKELIETFLTKAGADKSRIEFQLFDRPLDHANGIISVTYGPNTQLNPIPQRDDLRHANSHAVKPLLDKMLKLLRMRNDYLLLKSKAVK
ncbi:MAG TPA: OmpA family protein [Balneolaceae bacterium]|nr:OmpA family protein [Balneolaceae bacterium]